MGEQHASQGLLPPAIVAFDALMFIAIFFSLLALVPPLASSKLTRMKTWFSLLSTNILYCIIHLLLLGQQTGPPPSRGFCLLQAGLVYAAPPTLAAAAIIFVLELYLRLLAAVRAREFNQGPIYVMIWALPAVPTLIFWIDGVTALFNLESIKREANGLFCHIDMLPPTLITGISTSILILGTLWLEVLVVIVLARNGCLEVGSMGNITIGAAFPRGLFVRIVAISLTGMVALVLVGAIILQDNPSPASLIALAIMPMSISMLFLTQKDILAFYSGLRTRRHPPDATRLA